ncbi:xanthine dehydrogenase small subunit [Rhodobacteraceae bacterium RKSG542]|uniref:xanthine dehydrogenase small subunit n=1 Tax=Pseudovibrio flavus TaxID=2529854 RepID=UPI0012BC32BC|nr:xanthine dehydrogenase small subunit [Pseudovibrio flavus]MTI17541.1 xanthine dehydrogenase small subunit [Pseudovibrio flavus]
MRSAISFLRSGKVVSLELTNPTQTLLDYIRLSEKKTGTKEGCREGDCGACTVALGRLRDGELVYEPVNSCILLLGQIDGCELVTVEDLVSEGVMHPVQQALADHHGSQCGFCTPGFVMNLFTLYHQSKEGLSHSDITHWLSGNLCRCTGYRPIVDAALEACAGAANDVFSARAAETMRMLASINDGADVLSGSEDSFFASPASASSLAELYAKHTDATLVAGATDVGLWLTKQMRVLPKIISLNRVADLQKLAETTTGLHIGAGVTYAQAQESLAAFDPDIGEVISRIGSKQIRASGTIGGNIANGSPIGDSPPVLIALDATLKLRKGDVSRELPLEDFFIDYGKQDRGNAEFVEEIFVPRLDANQVFRAYKISKRFDQDISAVMAAFRFTLVENRITEARIAFGGMAATPKRAAGAETALIGVSLDDPSTWTTAQNAIKQDYSPITDMRASSAYRRDIAQALLTKALVEAAGTSTSKTRVVGQRPEGVTHAA